jgi:hypothetical protein
VSVFVLRFSCLCLRVCDFRVCVCVCHVYMFVCFGLCVCDLPVSYVICLSPLFVLNSQFFSSLGAFPFCTCVLSLCVAVLVCQVSTHEATGPQLTSSRYVTVCFVCVCVGGCVCVCVCVCAVYESRMACGFLTSLNVFVFPSGLNVCVFVCVLSVCVLVSDFPLVTCLCLQSCVCCFYSAV